MTNHNSKESSIDLDVLANAVSELTKKLSDDRSFNSRWVTLTEASRLKGICYKTLQNQKRLQPNGGEADGVVGGKRRWRRETIDAWLELTDADLGGVR